MEHHIIRNFTSKKLELASELAHKRVLESGCQKIYQDDHESHYSEEAQDLFNEYYSNYLDLINEIITH